MAASSITATLVSSDWHHAAQEVDIRCLAEVLQAPRSIWNAGFQRLAKTRWPAEASSTRPFMYLSNVACEGSHVRYFGGLASCPLDNLPLFRVWSQRSTDRSLCGTLLWSDCTLSRGASARTSTARWSSPQRSPLQVRKEVRLRQTPWL